MPLNEQQDLLVALYVAPAERKAWYDNPAAVEHRYGLDEATSAALRGLEHTALEFYATQLQEKRFAEIMKFVPITSSRYRSHLWRVFSSYAEKYIPVGPKKHIADAIAFDRFIHSIGETVSTEALNLLRFELVPWVLNFRLEEQLFTLKASEMTLRLIQAHRASGLRWQTNHFRWYLPFFIDRLRKARALELHTERSRVDSIGIFLKPPFASWHFEWYLPWPRRI